VIGGWENSVTVQYEGMARELEGDEAARLAGRFFARHPGSEHFAADPRTRFFVVAPTWIRYRDLDADPWDEWELRFGG